MALQFTLTVDKLKSCVKNNKQPEQLHAALSTLLPKYEIESVERVAGFLAQCGHESMDFTVLKENLNYGAKGLRSIFGKYFTDDVTATRYERKPEMIANKVYANRMGNGDEKSGDGYKYRGRGAIQLTGKENYTNFAKSIGKTLDETIVYLETLEGALESACWFWKKNGLNEIADKKDIVAMTKRINGGTIGLEDRKKHYEHNLEVLA
jgi:putative chitinase